MTSKHHLSWDRMLLSRYSTCECKFVCHIMHRRPLLWYAIRPCFVWHSMPRGGILMSAAQRGLRCYLYPIVRGCSSMSDLEESERGGCTSHRGGQRPHKTRIVCCGRAYAKSTCCSSRRLGPVTRLSAFAPVADGCKGHAGDDRTGNDVSPTSASVRGGHAGGCHYALLSCRRFDRSRTCRRPAGRYHGFCPLEKC